MRNTYAISALRHKRARLAGEIEAIEHTLAKRRTELAALDATLRLFHPDADPTHITSIRPAWRGIYFRQGDCPRLCLEALRDAAGPLPTSRIAEYAMRAKGLSVADGKIRDTVREFVRQALTRMMGRGKVRKIIHEVGKESWWELAA